MLELTLVTQEAWPKLHRAAEYRVEVLARGPARVHALNEIAVFQLGIAPACVMRVKALFPTKHTFIQAIGIQMRKVR